MSCVRDQFIKHEVPRSVPARLPWPDLVELWGGQGPTALGSCGWDVVQEDMVC